jgi:(p)ppGpp synthase/HD superfamily hydrolase
MTTHQQIVMAHYPKAKIFYSLGRHNVWPYHEGSLIGNATTEEGAWEQAAEILTGRLSSAFTFANKLHASQIRKLTNTPYVSHLMSVAALVMEYGGDQDCVISALLHDALEDQAASYERGPAGLRVDIEMYFGKRVLGIVEELTETDEDPKPPWTQRKRKYLAHLEKASPEAALVAACDKLHNVTTTLSDFIEKGNAVWDKFNSDRASQRWWYDEVMNTLSTRGDVPKVLLRRLELTIFDLFATKTP